MPLPTSRLRGSALCLRAVALAVPLLGLLLGLLASGAAWGPVERAGSVAAEEAPTCRHWAVLLPEDAGQHRVYDGLRKGLEVAQLERVCLRDVGDDEAAFAALAAWHRGLAAPAPLLFAIGRRAGARLLAAGFPGPGVLVSTEVTAAGTPLAPEPVLPGRVARVRAEVAAEQWGQVVRGLLGLAADARPGVLLLTAPPAGQPPGAAAPDAAGEAARRAFLTAARLEAATPLEAAGGAPPAVPARALLLVRLGAGAPPPPFAEALALARRLRLPLLADDPARFATGAAVVVVPDHQRAGRVAAEAGRRLWRGDDAVLAAPSVVRTTEVWVDVGAALEQGVDPPLAFLAAADRMRPPPRRAPSTGPGR